MVDTWITISSTILQNNNQGLLIVGLVKEMHKMSLEHLVVPESELVLKIKTKTPHNYGTYVQRIQEPTARAPGDQS